MVIVLIGPMGCGKTTIGRLLAERLGAAFEDADDFHPARNIDKMRAGIPLQDSDRMDWLRALAGRIELRRRAGQDLVLACSALKQAYRDILGVDQREVVSVYLKGSPDLLRQRVAKRRHAYMNAKLLDSQIATMESPEGGLTVDIGPAADRVCEAIAAALKELKETMP